MALNLLNYCKCLPRIGAIKKFPQITFKRNTTRDYAARMIGNREVVGYGWNGCPVYCDRLDYPMPAIRFQQETSYEMRCLRDKEKGDWKKLTMAEKKKLYRFSFCQTFAEFKAFNPDWKMSIGMGFWSIAFGVILTYIYFEFLYTHGYPETFQEERKQAQLKRIIALEMNPIDGLASKWDYDKNDWK